MKLNPEKKFVVEIATLQSMQPLIQWVADLALYLVTLLPATLHSGSVFAGAALLRNSRVLATVRELLVVARIWGLISNECLPTFSSTVSGYDILPQLFRLITRIWLVSRESPAHDFEESIVDECYSMSSQASIQHCHILYSATKRLWHFSCFTYSTGVLTRVTTFTLKRIYFSCFTYSTHNFYILGHILLLFIK